MKRKKLSRIIGVMLALMMLVSLTAPFASAAGTYTIEFLNPLGRIEPQDDQPLTERTPWILCNGQDGCGKPGEHLYEKKVVMRLQYDTTNTGDALALSLMDEFGKFNQWHPGAGIVYIVTGFGGNWGPKVEQNYNVNWIYPGGATGGPTYWQPPTGAPSDWGTLYSSGTGTYAGPVDIAIGGIAN